jgi:hypothetical protein
VAGLATSAASLMTVVILWIATQSSVVAVATGAAGNQMVRGVLYNAGHDVLSTIFGDHVFGAIQQTGPLGIAAALLGLVAAAGASIASLRALAAASSRRRV